MPVRPSLEEVLAYDGDETHIAVSVELSADSDTPISLYQKLAKDAAYPFLLDSAAGGERFVRYSFICVAPEAVLAW